MDSQVASFSLAVHFFGNHRVTKTLPVKVGMNAIKNYVDAHDLQTRDAADVIEEFGDEIAKMQGTCLDIGCGPGTVTRQLLLPKLPEQARVVGADISGKMVDFARNAHANEKRISFVKLDVESNELPPNLVNTYDNVVSFYCLHWCQNIRRVFENIYHMLRPGGKSLVLFIGHNSGFESYLKMHNDSRYKSYMKDVAKYIPYFQHSDNPRATLKKILEESGFDVIHCSFREKTFIYKSLDIFTKHVVAINPFIPKMPKDVGEQFINDLLRDILSRKISFGNTDNGSTEERKILDRYYLLIAYFKKTNISD